LGFFDRPVGRSMPLRQLAVSVRSMVVGVSWVGVGLAADAGAGAVGAA
jgi:hypothetical protein